MAKQIVATEGSFARIANMVFGTDFEEIDYSYPKDSYVEGKGVDVSSSKILEREAGKTERNIEKCKAISGKLIGYEFLAGQKIEPQLHIFGKTLVDSGYKFFIMTQPNVIMVPSESSSSDPRWQAAVDAAGIRGQLVHRASVGYPCSILGILHPAWRYGRDWLVTRDDPLYYKWQAYVLPDTGYTNEWGFIYNRLIPCGTPPGFQRRQGCDENDLTPSVGAKLVARTKVVYYLPSSTATSPNPPIGIPAPQPWPGTGGGPQPTPQPTPQPIDQQKILLIGGIALLALMGIILITSD